MGVQPDLGLDENLEKSEILRNLIFDFATSLVVVKLFVIIRNVRSRVVPDEIPSRGLTFAREGVAARRNHQN